MPGCRPGPGTVLTEEEDDQLASYLTQMSDMGFGLSHDTVSLSRLLTMPNVSTPLKTKRRIVHGSMASVTD